MPPAPALPPGYGPPPATALPSAHAQPAPQPTAAPPQPGYAPGYPQPAPGYPPQAGYPQPAPGYPQPAYPPQGYAMPPHMAPGWAPQAPPKGPRTLGLVALLGAAVGILIASVLAVVASVNLGPSVMHMIDNVSADGDLDLTYLSSVRGWVLVGELSFWFATAVGIWAIVQGGIATAKRRGRGWGVAAIIVGATGPFLFVGLAGFSLLYAMGSALPS